MIVTYDIIGTFYGITSLIVLVITSLWRKKIQSLKKNSQRGARTHDIQIPPRVRGNSCKSLTLYRLS